MNKSLLSRTLLYVKARFIIRSMEKHLTSMDRMRIQNSTVADLDHKFSNQHLTSLGHGLTTIHLHRRFR